MSANIGANIASLHAQQAQSRDTAATSLELHTEAESWTATFQEDVNAMATEAKAHMDTFAEMVHEASTRLKATVDATEWVGQAAEAKQERIAEVDASVASFRDRMEQASEDFRIVVQDVIADFYAGITGEVRTAIEAMHETWNAEADHVRAMADELEDLDRRAAGL
jgi:gas vesicle protein